MANQYANNGGWDLNDLGSSTTAHGFSSQSVESGGMCVFYPYAIEEPQDEPCSPIHRELPRLPDHFEKWQRDLVNDMGDLECNSTSRSVANKPMSCSQGQKRKSSSPEYLVDQHTFHTQAKPKINLTDKPRHDPGLCPKRRRQHRRMPGIHTASTPKFSEVESCGNSSLDPHSTDESSPDSMNDSAVTDEMEID